MGNAGEKGKKAARKAGKAAGGGWQPQGELWLGRGGEPGLGGIRVLLLEKIAETGSLTRAARAAGISYRTAWTLLENLNALSHAPLVESAAGGSRGGGSRLTPHGRELLGIYRSLQEEHSRHLAGLRERIKGFARLGPAVRRLSLSTSARNQLHGIVHSVREAGLHADVVLRIGGRRRVHARITRTGLESLGMRKGDPAYALIKANWVDIVPAEGSSAFPGMNRLRGRIASVRSEGGMLERILRLPGGGSLVSSLPGPGPGQRGLGEGRTALAVFDPRNVILGVGS